MKNCRKPAKRHISGGLAASEKQSYIKTKTASLPGFGVKNAVCFDFFLSAFFGSPV